MKTPPWARWLGYWVCVLAAAAAAAFGAWGLAAFMFGVALLVLAQISARNE